ncbi:DNA-3-methyladenine glycosylase 2 family protein [Brevibacillus antibioticus]|uniref:DNA-3-methyladenine glycosylase II n=1 Tax=Brevibacillus antibioticus TaxID=2570228 RepID=A0A4U2YCK4_9BACL|nr:DNA-3-methyladenine glycosylase [Brevibacillus antibioticus]TKI57792.1 DNA-3-methyladenine glycosylase 2 family protein [Brevibacillus antibioticus]
MTSSLSHEAWVDNREEIILSVPAEFSFSQNLQYLSRASNECMFHIQNGRLYKAIPIEQDSQVVEIHADNEQGLTVRFLSPSLPTEQVRTEVARYIRDWFDLDRDLVPFYELAAGDALLQQSVEKFYGLRTMGIPDLFEALSWGIIGQQINLTYAYTLKRRLVETFGRQVEFEGQTYWLFPTAEKIAGLSVADLDGLHMTTKKCEYLIDVAQLIVEGKLSKELLWDGGDYQTAEKRLTSIRGIGPWTANYVLMRCLRIPSAFPIDDVGLHNAIKFLLGKEKKPTKAEIRELSKAWTNWESYATFYLWRFLY